MLFSTYVLDFLHQFETLQRSKWNYEDGCVLLGAQDLFAATGDDRFLVPLLRYYEKHILPDGEIPGYDPGEFNLDRVPPARPLFFLYASELSGEKARNAISQVRGQLERQPRTASGSFWHKGIYPDQIWLDGLYMAQPFQCLYEREFGEDCYTDTVKQFETVHRLMFDREQKLHYHCCDESRRMFWADPETGLSAQFWARSIGWHCMALIDCWAIIPPEHAMERDRLAELFREAVQGMTMHRDAETDLVYQLIALPREPGNYLETSASAMLAYCLLKGARLGVLPDDSAKLGTRILLSLMTRKLTYERGGLSLKDICPGTGLGPEDRPERDGSIVYYLSGTPVSDEEKGVGVCMMAFAEWMRSQNRRRKNVLCMEW